MKTNLNVPQSQTVQAFYLFFIVHTIQIGAGLMGVPRILFLDAQADAWISVAIAGVYLHFIAWIMIKILRGYENADILGIQTDLFGKFVGKTLGIFYLLYIFLILLSVIKNYIEVVQVFIFPEIPIWLMSLFLLSLMVYSVTGGFRVVVGTSFLFFLLTIWLVLTISKPITYMDWGHFTPILQTSWTDILKGAQRTAYTVLGMEILFFVYPYIKNKKNIALPVHLGLAMTTFLVMLVTVVSIGYFSPDHLRETVWATLSLFKIISFPVIERFDFIAVALWMMVVLPNIVLLCWMLVHSLKRLFHLKEKHSIFGVSVLLFIGALLVEYRMDIDLLTEWTARVGFWLVFVYPIFLFLYMKLVHRWRRRRRA
ncbi:spore gernimation protein [Halobacillus fulvus]|nr:spore gernimation protein [Halobacillus fulvus]